MPTYVPPLIALALVLAYLGVRLVLQRRGPDRPSRRASSADDRTTLDSLNDLGNML